MKQLATLKLLEEWLQRWPVSGWVWKSWAWVLEMSSVSGALTTHTSGYSVLRRGNVEPRHYL